MNVQDVEKRVQTIREMAGDDEAAHSHEDQLHQTLLLAIAEGKCTDPADCARAALKTQEIDFARWCA